MNLLARFEGAAERFFTGVFGKNSVQLQPVEIAKELAKQMFRHKQVSISKVYVPNVYRVYLNSTDWRPLASFGDAFLMELSRYLYAEGNRYGYTFLSKPYIELHADDTVNQHEMFIETGFDDALDFDWEEEDKNESGPEEGWQDKTTVLKGLPLANEVNDEVNEIKDVNAESRNCGYVLEVIEGPDSGKEFALAKNPFYIGRHNQCELQFNDPEISRRHLKVTPADGGWLLEDLGSTNGTWLNDQRISHQAIAAGDKIQIGQTVIAIRPETPS